MTPAAFWGALDDGRPTFFRPEIIADEGPALATRAPPVVPGPYRQTMRMIDRQGGLLDAGQAFVETGVDRW
tara:strand:+ start:23535 stop:23747 length:213 start_codon:yes stop_codon:yes gene_type:complete